MKIISTKRFIQAICVSGAIMSIKGYQLLLDFSKTLYISRAADLRQCIINVVAFIALMLISIIYLLDIKADFRNAIIVSVLLAAAIPGGISFFIFTKFQTCLFFLFTILIVSLIGREQDKSEDQVSTNK